MQEFRKFQRQRLLDRCQQYYQPKLFNCVLPALIERGWNELLSDRSQLYVRLIERVKISKPVKY